jgi:uncharacterized membrane protein
MKKLMLLAIVAAAVVVFTQCRSAKNTASSKKMTSYAADIQPLVADKCSPCHIPDKGGRVAALNTYEKVKTNIDDILRRIQLNPGDKGFMPFKHPKLSDSTINVFKQWKEGGMAE